MPDEKARQQSTKTCVSGIRRSQIDALDQDDLPTLHNLGQILVRSKHYVERIWKVVLSSE